MHAVPIQISATVHTTARTGAEMNKAAITVAQGIHHAKVLARGLASQSREGCAEESTMVPVRTT